MSKGALFAIGAYVLWGLLPLFWKILEDVPAFQILCHRISWSLVFLLFIQIVRKNFNWLKSAFKNKRTVITFFTTSVLLSANWFTYIWAVNNGRTIEASLGYFINPLLSVMLGVFFLRERPDRWSWIAISLAFIGIIYTIIVYGSVPWVALVLAGSFSIYGLLRKQAVLNSIQGLTFETLLLFLPATAMLIYFEIKGIGSFGHVSLTKNFYLFFAGVATSIPLILFATAARRIELTTLGILQYIAPTLQLFIGLFIFKEDLSRSNLIGFSFVWVALIIYTINNIVVNRRRKWKLDQTKS
ncbi:MAG: EamA family transporter RarD [Candidatus Cloacimonetes bacterium]|nr:EamA family transporter RarD [Candidatus Cloacimonadota bacterium]MBT4332646.1 EamA family transporter RarD [Candidatus Cloacimonadota bacterium]